VLAAVALVAAVADAATLNKRARLREGPSKDTRLLGFLEAGTVVEIDAERSGWYLVRTPDGQSGYVWEDHLRFEPAAGRPQALGATATTTVQHTAVPTSTAPPATLDPRAPAATPGDGAVIAELERLRNEVARLAAAQQDLLPRVGQPARPGPSPAPLAGDGSAGAAALFTVIGGVVGWLLGRFAPGRRERRSRLRL
jgi:hypothetical protein